MSSPVMVPFLWLTFDGPFYKRNHFTGTVVADKPGTIWENLYILNKLMSPMTGLLGVHELVFMQKAFGKGIHGPWLAQHRHTTYLRMCMRMSVCRSVCVFRSQSMYVCICLCFRNSLDTNITWMPYTAVVWFKSRSLYTRSKVLNVDHHFSQSMRFCIIRSCSLNSNTDLCALLWFIFLTPPCRPSAWFLRCSQCLVPWVDQLEMKTSQPPPQWRDLHVHGSFQDSSPAKTNPN